MDYQQMDRNKILKRLQTYKKYQGLSQKKIGEQLGNIHTLRQELASLDAQFKQFAQFAHFEQLPGELQATILEQDVKTLKSSQKLNKKISQSPQVSSSYYHQFCNLPFTLKEIQSYINEVLPNKIMFLVTPEFQMLTKIDGCPYPNFYLLSKLIVKGDNIQF